jgi:hypothetical protein
VVDRQVLKTNHRQQTIVKRTMKRLSNHQRSPRVVLPLEFCPFGLPELLIPLDQTDHDLGAPQRR